MLTEEALIQEFLFQCTCKILKFCVFILYAFVFFFLIKKFSNSDITSEQDLQSVCVYVVIIRYVHAHTKSPTTVRFT
jgi:phosphotransferase system  glucose/maltose/N-acetylglucosamine-specific IIC component